MDSFLFPQPASFLSTLSIVYWKLEHYRDNTRVFHLHFTCPSQTHLYRFFRESHRYHKAFNTRFYKPFRSELYPVSYHSRTGLMSAFCSCSVFIFVKVLSLSTSTLVCWKIFIFKVFYWRKSLLVLISVQWKKTVCD